MASDIVDEVSRVLDNLNGKMLNAKKETDAGDEAFELC
jgi:hypothetical protein